MPGPIRGGACPSPREIMVIEVPKVFDLCFQEDTLERCFFIQGLGTTSTVAGCDITNITCSEVGAREPIADQDALAVVSVQINVTLSITLQNQVGQPPTVVTRNIAFPKRVVLCAPAGTDIRCDVRGICICTVQTPPTGQPPAANEPNVCCTVQLCTTIKTVADINILVPTFGIVVPQACRTAAAGAAGCPPIPPDVCRPTAMAARDRMNAPSDRADRMERADR